MISKKLFVVIILFICFCFSTCENQIISKWWVEEEEEQAYIPIIRDIPFETIIEVIKENPGTNLQDLKIIAIEYIIFSGDQHKYNEIAKRPAITDLTTEEKNTNNKTIDAMAQSMKANPNYLIMLHGHANPANGTMEEYLELKDISEARAYEVAKKLRTRFIEIGGNVASPPWGGPVSYDIETWQNNSVWESATWGPVGDRRMYKPTGYEGKNTLFPANSTYAGLNRRVEMILFEIITTP